MSTFAGIDQVEYTPTWTKEMEIELRQRLFIWWERRKCAEKKSYGSEGTARLMAEQITRMWHRERKSRRKALEPYQCRWCGAWHLVTVVRHRQAEAA